MSERKDIEEQKLQQRITQRLAWIRDKQPIDANEFIADILKVLRDRAELLEVCESLIESVEDFGAEGNAHQALYERAKIAVAEVNNEKRN